MTSHSTLAAMPFLVAFGLACLSMPLARRVGFAVGLVDAPGDLKIHPASIPVTGGIAVVLSVVLAITLSGRIFPPALLGGIGLMVTVGVIDDLRPLPPSVRVIVQICAGVLIATGWGGGWSWPLVAAGSAGLVVACANGVNLIDGQDGLAGGLAAIAALGMASLMTYGVLSEVQLALGGALAGFLLWNRAPARIFLGNGGAYAVGTFLAAGAVEAVTSGGARGLLAAGSCLAIFAFELAFTVGRRLRMGESLVGGDRSHSYDLLSRRYPRPVVTLAFWLAGTSVALVGLAVSRMALEAAAAAVTATGACVAWAGFRLWSTEAPDTAVEP